MKTQKELEQEWGLERVVTAMGILANWRQGQQHPISKEAMLELHAESEDAFELFKVRMFSK